MARDLKRLAERVQKRRAELGIGIEPIARLAGMSKDTWKRIEGLPDGPKSVRDQNYEKADRALSWAVGSCIAVLEGGEPIPIERSAVTPGVVYASVPQEDLGDEIRLAVTNAMVAATDLTAAEIREVNQRAIEELRRRGLLPRSGGD